MVTKEIEIVEPIAEIYEPSIQDKIQRIIYRL